MPDSEQDPEASMGNGGSMGMKLPDRDEEHRRRREVGETADDPDGRAVAAALYGGDTDALEDDTDDDSDQPTLFE